MSTARYVSRLARTVAPVRAYASVSTGAKDAEAKATADAKETLAQSKKELPAPGDIRDELRRANDSFNKHYKELHAEISGLERAQSAYPEALAKAESTDASLTAKRREYKATLINALDSSLKTVYDKHGEDGFLYVTSKLEKAIEMGLNATNEPIRVAVTGAAGQIGYSTLFRIASGAAFGDNPVILQLLELPGAMNALKGVEMELRDCAFPQLRDVVLTDDPEKAFEGADYILMVGAMPRSKGMERADLLKKNAEIFSTQGKAMNKTAKRDKTRVVVVGNPANTNALIAQRNAPNVPAENFIAMTRLDHNRGLSMLAELSKARVDEIEGFVVWGNHSATMFPDIAHTTIAGKPAGELIAADVVTSKFIPAVQQRGAAIIAARGLSSAASAGSSAIDQMRDWHYGTAGKWTSAAVVSDGAYGVDQGLFYSYPVVFKGDGTWAIVRDLPVDAKAAELMEKTHKELQGERDAVASLLPKK